MATVRSTTESDGAAQWVDAAYSRFCTAGLAAVRVEAIARDVGTSKGSFYWHFSNRAELVAAVMQRWELEETQRAIALAEAAGTARERITALFEAVAARTASRAGELLLYSEAAAEGVEATVAAVSQRRIDYVAGLLEEIGFAPQEARARSVVCLSMVLGARQLVGIAGLELPHGRDLTHAALELILSGAPSLPPTRQ